MAVIAIASQLNAEALANNAMAITAIKILKNQPSLPILQLGLRPETCCYAFHVHLPSR